MIVITRPSSDAREYAIELEDEGISALVEPMLDIQNTAFEMPDISRYQGLIFTSANAVRAYIDQGGALAMPVFCVGGHTTLQCRGAGAQNVHDADGDAQDLVDLIVSKTKDKTPPFLHIRGEHVARPIDDMLAEHGIRVAALVVYQAVQVDHFSQPFLNALSAREIQAITFFSKRTAQAFLELITQYDLADQLSEIKALSISDSVLEYTQSHQWQGTYKSDKLDRKSMLELIKRVCP